MFGKNRAGGALAALTEQVAQMRESVEKSVASLAVRTAEHAERLKAHDEDIAAHKEALRLHDGRLDADAERLREDRAAIRALEQLLKGHGRAIERQNKTAALQQEQLDRLKRRVDGLVESRDETIWEDATRAAFERATVNRVADEERFPYKAALNGLAQMGRLVRDGAGKRTRPVRSQRTGNVVRAVVVFKEDGCDG